MMSFFRHQTGMHTAKFQIMTPCSPLKAYESVTSIISGISRFGEVTAAQRTDLLAPLDYATFQKGSADDKEAAHD